VIYTESFPKLTDWLLMLQQIACIEGIEKKRLAMLRSRSCPIHSRMIGSHAGAGLLGIRNPEVQGNYDRGGASEFCTTPPYGEVETRGSGSR
jgi:hypothetical protein